MQYKRNMRCIFLHYMFSTVGSIIIFKVLLDSIYHLMNLFVSIELNAFENVLDEVKMLFDGLVALMKKRDRQQDVQVHSLMSS